MATMMEEITRLMDLDLDRCKPGEGASMDAYAIGDGLWQGDLGLMVVESPPSGYAVVKNLSDADAKLVPGSTQGSRHCLDSVVGVKMWRPNDWGAGESLGGPCFVADRPVMVLHPTHGPVSIPPGMMVLCGYQRELDAETKRERRNRD